MASDIDELFPFDEFRGKQKLVIEACIDALYKEGYDNVVIDAPVGAGKSAINMTLLKKASNGFYTTPSKALRQQLMADDVLSKEFVGLKARRDYTCGITGQNCEDCDINQSSEQSCAEQGPKCTYWSNKMSAINSDIAAVTFSYLIVDNMLPESNGDTPVSFGNREMEVVDEAQNLDLQTASLHAGYKISPFSLPRSVFTGATESADLEANSYEDVKNEVGTIYARAKDYARDIPQMEMEPAEKKCVQLAEKIEWMKDEIDRGNHWVADVERTKYGGSYVKTIELQPVNVSSFLKNNIWSRASKRIISTATLPYRDMPEIWLRKVGLDPENTQVISVGMRFPVENRPIHTEHMVASMSSKGDQKNWDSIMEKMNELAQNHYGTKGLVHTASYARAKKIAKTASSKEHPYLDNNIYVHDQKEDPEVEVEKWQNSDRDIFLSPSMMEGVDLKDDMCRWQVLLKVPYPAMDSRTEYIVNNQKYGWVEYKERAMIRVVQSYGRAVRSDTDYADYYVLDKDFNDLMNERSAPEWFEEAIGMPSVSDNSVFDY
jgi:Rad3-related DNA helicase